MAEGWGERSADGRHIRYAGAHGRDREWHALETAQRDTRRANNKNQRDDKKDKSQNISDPNVKEHSFTRHELGREGACLGKIGTLPMMTKGIQILANIKELYIKMHKII